MRTSLPRLHEPAGSETWRRRTKGMIIIRSQLTVCPVFLPTMDADVTVWVYPEAALDVPHGRAISLRSRHSQLERH